MQYLIVVLYVQIILSLDLNVNLLLTQFLLQSVAVTVHQKNKSVPFEAHSKEAVIHKDKAWVKIIIAF